MHGAAEHTLDRRKDGLRQCFLAVENSIDSRVVRVIDRTEFTMVNQRLHAFFSQVISELLPIAAFVAGEAAQLTCASVFS